MLRTVFWIAVSATLLVGARPSSAQESSCADCHFANPQADPYSTHLFDWENSAHGRERVGCEKCHGGDASSFEPFIAHRGILASRNPASPTNDANLPQTCGTCHTGPFVAFQRSRHFELLGEEREDGPTCSTCHGSVAANLLSPRRLEQQCLRCHADGGDHPQPEVALHGRVLLEEVSNVRRLLRQAESQIERVGDENRRREFQEAYDQAQVPLTEAVSNAHAFVFEQMRERLSASRERAEILLNELANPN